MKRNLITSVCAGLALWAVGTMTAQGAITNAYITFSVDMSSNLVAGTFNPSTPAIIGGISYGGTGTDTVYARGIFDGWANPGFQLVQVGTSGVYTNTVADTAAQDLSDGNANYQYACYLNGVLTDEDGSGSGWANRSVYLPTINNGVVVVPTSYFNDGGPATTNNITFQVDMSEQILLGRFNPVAGDYVVVAGSYENFAIPPNSTPSPFIVTLTNNPNILVTNSSFTPPLVLSNVWVGTGAIYTDSAKPIATVGCNQQYKYVIIHTNGSAAWDQPQFPNMDVYSGNRFYAMSGDQVLPLVNFSDTPYSIAHVTLSCDMGSVMKYDTNFMPNSVTVWGSYDGWSGPTTMIQNPPPNQNIFTATNVTMSEGSALIIQVRYTNMVANLGQPGYVYDYVNDSVHNNNARRTITLPLTSGPLVTNMPTFYFLDLAPDDYLPKDTAVRFSVDMNGALTTNGTPVNPADGLYINGMFANGGPGNPYPQEWYPWSGGANPVSAPPGYQMIQQGSTTIYTNTIVIPAGTPVAISYQYGTDVGNFNGGPIENEAGLGVNHFRVIRTTAGGLYTLPTDTFTNQPYQEPLFAPGNIYESMGTVAGGNLKVGTASAGTVPVSWLGRPGAHIQTASSITGPWTDVWSTDGTNWTSGVNTTNGLMSTTNWPTASGITFFRLVKP